MNINSRLKKLEALKKTSKEPEYDFSTLTDEEVNRLIELVELEDCENNPEFIEINKKVKRL